MCVIISQPLHLSPPTLLRAANLQVENYLQNLPSSIPRICSLTYNCLNINITHYKHFCVHKKEIMFLSLKKDKLCPPPHNLVYSTIYHCCSGKLLPSLHCSINRSNALRDEKAKELPAKSINVSWKTKDYWKFPLFYCLNDYDWFC